MPAPDARPPVLEVRKLSKAFGGLKVSHDVSFSVRRLKRGRPSSRSGSSRRPSGG